MQLLILDIAHCLDCFREYDLLFLGFRTICRKPSAEERFNSWYIYTLRRSLLQLEKEKNACFAHGYMVGALSSFKANQQWTLS